MSHAVSCHDCEETIWPPLDVCGPGGQTEIAACRLALEHAREDGHTDVHVIAGCYYAGEGERPTAFGDGVTDPADVVVPERSELANAVAGAARTLQKAADGIESGRRREPVARRLRDMAEATASRVTEDDLTHLP